MSMDAHIQSVKCAMYFHLRAIKKIRHFLDRETCIRAVISLVMSRLDYCNVGLLLIGKSAAARRGLQVAENYAARVITGLGIRTTPQLLYVNSIGCQSTSASNTRYLLWCTWPSIMMTRRATFRTW